MAVDRAVDFGRTIKFKLQASWAIESGPDPKIELANDAASA
jgi:hypothetical protein